MPSHDPPALVQSVLVIVPSKFECYFQVSYQDNVVPRHLRCRGEWPRRFSLRSSGPSLEDLDPPLKGLKMWG